MDGFARTAAGPVPRVRTYLRRDDRVGDLRARLGTNRHDFKVVPGLYCVGEPDRTSPVLVTANYKLTFDTLRERLTSIDAWLLVVDTRGINVWCAAGKGLFTASEVAFSVNAVRLHQVVEHRELILPQLAATGVAAREVERICGFKVLWGPIRARDLPAFLRNGNKADEAMRGVTFTLRERAALIPVELYQLRKPLFAAIPLLFLLSALGPDLFSPPALWQRGISAVTATLVGALAGSVLVPLFLNRLPWRQFWPKGALVGGAAGTLAALYLPVHGWADPLALTLWATAVASWQAMNFTGSTPYTSPSGVEKEMRRGMPLQALAALAAAGLWLAGPFLG
ncbi:CO dehydrogenase/acetyl-CoA synthase delta subunit, TIM barrel [Pseudodesulfovibrio mercurii]|uniref:CO dehydrogenase/acetyl-CoA synthase delta subunit, TIM barrel n=1 Tax=Pseudodesulfovibrio mercurii TaxID=641491 RepID=F0JBF0_9BACT|nr:CO dehydrogenase/acetyl-CoA synthase delta subunit, TIM barrel [Pseudodesulfovibrio mercurii]